MPFRPVTPQYAAGSLIEPPPSVPTAPATSRAPTAAAEPPLDPPPQGSTFHGLPTGPYALTCPVEPPPQKCMLVTPTTTAPAWRSTRWMPDSPAGICSCGLPSLGARQGSANMSFTAI